MIIVIDASVAIAWIASDAQNSYADATLAACGSDRAVVPGLWHWEVANTLVVLERKGRLIDAGAVYATLVRYLPISIANGAAGSHGLEEIELAQRHQLSIYDAAYLALAKTSSLPLATLDGKLARAAATERVLFSP